jgi:CRP-like cAMP-binding protein
LASFSLPVFKSSLDDFIGRLSFDKPVGHALRIEQPDELVPVVAATESLWRGDSTEGTKGSKLGEMASQAAQIRRAAFAAALRRCYLFSALSVRDLECVASFVVQKRLGKGDWLFREGAPCLGFYVVDRGAISVHRINASGKMQVIHIFRPGESFAEAALVENRGYPADACALEQTSVLLVPKDPFLDLLKKRSELALRMLGSMSRHLHALVALIDDLTLKDVQARLVCWLLKRCAKPLAGNVVIRLDQTKSLLASEFGTTNETLSRTFAELRNLKLIVVNGRSITIPNPYKLEEYLTGSHKLTSR